MMKLFQFSHEDYEIHNPVLFYGPDETTEDKWRFACEAAVNVAISNLIARTPDDEAIRTSDIHREACVVLGGPFERAEPVKAHIWGNCMGDEPEEGETDMIHRDMVKALQVHNRRYREGNQ